MEGKMLRGSEVDGIRSLWWSELSLYIISNSCILLQVNTERTRCEVLNCVVVTSCYMGGPRHEPVFTCNSRSGSPLF
jgi:hypothetical protein